MSRTDDRNLAGAAKSPAVLVHKEGYTIEDYRLIERIGEGSFGAVWRADRAGFEVALKILNASMNSEETKKEVEVLERLKKLHHKFLVQTLNFWSDGDRLYIEMELADGGSLKDRLKAYQAMGKFGIPEDELLKHFEETAKALDYLHGHRPVFLHRDIKPANILLVQSCAKIADFGLLRQVSGDNDATKTQGGTFPYMAPESITESRFSVHTDLFSFAVMYAELRQGELPFLGNNQFQICEKIVKSPPKLNDVFHPEERKVLLRALEKNPAARFSSCGEFVFELNRVVPWVPAVDVRKLELPAAPPATAPTRSTDAKPPKAETGTSRTKAPRPTMPDVDLPPEVDRSRGASTVSGGAGTVVAESRPGKPSGEPAKTPVHTPEPVKPRKIAAPIETPVLPPPRKFPAGPLAAILLLVVLIGGATGIWFLANLAAQDDVRDLIDKKKYVEAMQKIKDTSGFVLPSAGTLQKDVEDKWWTDLKTPGRDEPTDRWAAFLGDLTKFEGSFPKHDGVEARRTKGLNLLTEVVSEEVDRRLKTRKVETVETARLVVADIEKVLPDLGKTLTTRIDHKGAVLVALQRAEDAFKENKFEQCQSYLKAKLTFEYKDDLEQKNKLIESADAGISAREKQHAKLWGELLAAKKAGKAQLVKDTLAEVVKFRRDYPKDRWQPVLDDGGQPGLDKLIAEAWTLLHAEGVVVEDCSRKVEELDNQPRNPTDEKHFLALQAFLKAHKAKSPVEWEQAWKSLIALVREQDQPAELNQKLWLALVPLAKTQKLVSFDDLDALEKTLSDPIDEPIKTANSQVLTEVLERLIQKDNYLWFAKKMQMGRYLTWCDRIDRPTDSTLALKVECLVEQGAALDKINKVTFSLKGVWYGDYVHALVSAKDKGSAVAADKLVTAIAGKSRNLKPKERADRASDILRDAVRKLGRKGQEFTNEADAKNAIRWLTLVLDLQEQAQLDKDLIDLAFAAAKTDAADVAKQLEKSANPTKLKGYYWLAKAFMAKGKSEKQALDFFDLALKVPATDKDDDRKLAAKDAAKYAWDLSDSSLKKSAWVETIDYSLRCQAFAYEWSKMDMATGADWNLDAVKVQAIAAYNNAKEGEKVEKYYAVVAERAAQPKAKEFLLPVVFWKVEFASKNPANFAGSKEQLVALTGEAKTELELARKLADTGKHPKKWMNKVLCTGMVSMGDASLVFVGYKINKKELDVKNDKAAIKGEFAAILNLYLEARELKEFPEEWEGSLAHRIGNTYFSSCDLAADEKMMKAEARLSEQYLRQALTGLEAAPTLTDGQKGILAKIKSDLKDLQDPKYK